MMQNQIIAPRGAKYSLQSVVQRLPQDVSQTLFLKLANHCRPGVDGITVPEFQQFVAVTRSFQQLPSSAQIRLLSKPVRQQGKQVTALESQRQYPDPLEQEVWMKERVNESYSQVRDLRRLGVASASNLWAVRRSSSPRLPKDWANVVLDFHYCKALTVQDSVTRYLERLDNAFLQLPDRRWYIKYQGEAIPPLADKFGGLSCINALIRDNHLGTIVVREKGEDPHFIFMPTSSALSDKQRLRNFHTLDFKELKACGLKRFDAIRGNQSYDSGKSDDKVVDSRSNPERKQISRAIRKIATQNSRIAGALDAAISVDSAGVLSFKEQSGSDWATDIKQLPYDALMEKTPSGWRVRTPLSEEPVEIPGNREKGMGYIARTLQLTGVAVPVGLLANSVLLDALNDRPPYQKLFKRTYQRLIRLDNHFDCDEGTRTIIAAVTSARGYGSKYYEVTHEITPNSLLAKYMPTGLVSLTPEGLGGVLYLLKKCLAAATIEGTKTRELVDLVNDMDRAVAYVTRYESLASEIEPESNAASDKVQKAIASAIDQFWKTGEQSLGKYFDNHIKTGKLCSHNGPWLWEVKGLAPQFPDVVELAKDHIYMKFRRLARREAGFSESNRPHNKNGRGLRKYGS